MTNSKEENKSAFATIELIASIVKKLLKISNEKISELEIPTGNPLIINLNSNLEVKNYKYLDKTREAKIRRF